MVENGVRGHSQVQGITQWDLRLKIKNPNNEKLKDSSKKTGVELVISYIDKMERGKLYGGALLIQDRCLVLHFLTLPPLPFRAHLLLFTNTSSVTQASQCLELVSQGSFSSCTQGSTGLLSNKFSVGYILSCLFVINYHF